MDFKFFNVGFGSFVSAAKVVAIVDVNSAPAKRIVQGAYEQGVVIDATYGRKTRSAIVTDSGHVVLSSLQKAAVSRRVD